jgi:hypothetical protein
MAKAVTNLVDAVIRALRDIRKINDALRPSLFTITRVYIETAGSVLDQAVTAGSPAAGGRVKVEAITDYDDDGGVGRFYRPELYDETSSATYEEFLYSGIDEDTEELTGVTRPNPVTWSAGITFVQEGSEATVEKVADGYFDDEEVPAIGIPIPAHLYPYFPVGPRAQGFEETVWVGQISPDDDQVFVLNAPVGAVPSFDDDREVLPPVGGGNSSTVVVDPNSGKILPPKGMGYEDGVVPSTGVTPVVTGGIGNVLFIRFPTIANSSIVKYKVHVHTTNDFTPAANTLVGIVELAGTPGFTGLYVLKDFPAGHVLDGGAADPPQAGSTYRVKIVPADGSGEFAGPYTQASGSPLDITADLIAAAAVTTTKIADNAITTPKLIAGAVTAAKILADTITANEIAALTITAGEIATSTITASKMLITAGLSSITADIGAIIAGTITGVVITGGTVRSATGPSYTEISNSLGSAIDFIVSSARAGRITGFANELTIQDKNLVTLLTVTANQIEISGLADLKVSGAIWIGTDAGEPPTGYFVLYKDANNLMAKAPGRTAVVVAAL